MGGLMIVFGILHALTILSVVRLVASNSRKRRTQDREFASLDQQFQKLAGCYPVWAEGHRYTHDEVKALRARVETLEKPKPVVEHAPPRRFVDPVSNDLPGKRRAQ